MYDNNDRIRSRQGNRIHICMLIYYNSVVYYRCIHEHTNGYDQMKINNHESKPKQKA